MLSDNRLMIFVLLLLYILGVSYIGYRNRKSQNSEDYFLASRSLPSWLLAITFIASWWGGGSAIDLVDQAHGQGISTFWIYGVPVLIAVFLMFLFAGGIRRVGTISQSELAERRYDSRVAFMLTLFIIIFMTIGAAIQVIVVGRMFQSFFGVSYELAAIFGTLLVLFYSMFGGFRGVVMTDLLQFVFFLFSSVFLFCVAYSRSGGFEVVGELAATQGKGGYTDFMHNIGDNLAYVITFGTSWMIQANVWQRISAAHTPRSARGMMIISFLVFIPLYLIVTLTGMLTLPLYDSVPEGGIVPNIIHTLDFPMIEALLFIGLTSAIMSTMDSLFNAGSLSLTIDLYKRHIAPNKKPSTYVMIGRISTIVIGLLALLIGLKVDSILTISWIGADFLATGAFVPLVVGFIWRGGTSTAALSSMIFGLCFSLYNMLIALGADMPVGWEIASAEQALVGISASTVIYFSVSLLWKEDRNKANKFIESLKENPTSE